MKQPIEYVPPNAEVVDQYVERTSEALAQRFSLNTETQQIELRRGLNLFVKTILRIHIKYLNRGGLHDEFKAEPKAP